MKAYQNEVLSLLYLEGERKSEKLIQTLSKIKPMTSLKYTSNEAIEFPHPRHAFTQVQALSFAPGIPSCLFALHS